MNIIHIITTIERGGAENQLQQLSKRQVEVGLNVFVIYLKGSPVLKDDLNLLGIKVFTIKSAYIHIFILKNIFRRWLQKEKWIEPRTIIHAHLPRAELYAALISHLYRLPLVVTRHNCEQFWPRVSPQISRTLSNFVVRNSQSIVCISNAVRDYLENSKEVNQYHRYKLSVVHYGIDQSKKFSKEYSKLTSKPKVEIGTLSRLEPQKDLPTLIRAFHLVQHQRPNVVLNIHGVGKEENVLRELVNELNLENKVFIKGKVNSIEKFFTRCDIFILSSLYEGFGMVLLESCQYKTALLASNSKAACEVLQNSQSLLFDIGNFHQLSIEILRLIEDENALATNIKCGQKILESYDIKKSEAQLRSIYES